MSDETRAWMSSAHKRLKKPEPLTWFTMDGREFPECPTCLGLMADPGLVAACASVGIESGRSTFQMMRGFLADYHERGHR